MDLLELPLPGEMELLFFGTNMPYALIVEGEVREVIGDNPEGKYHPSLQWVEAPQDVAPGYRYDGQEFSPPPPPPPPPPNWKGFYYAFEDSPLEDRLFEAIDKKALGKLQTQFNNAPTGAPDIERLRVLWNRTLNSLGTPLDPRELDLLRGLIKEHNIPFTVDQRGGLNG